MFAADASRSAVDASAIADAFVIVESAFPTADDASVIVALPDCPFATADASATAACDEAIVARALATVVVRWTSAVRASEIENGEEIVVCDEETGWTDVRETESCDEEEIAVNVMEIARGRSNDVMEIVGHGNAEEIANVEIARVWET